MAGRDVTVRLRLSVRDYLAGGTQAELMDKRLMASQEALGNSAKKTGGQLDDLGKKTEANGRKIGRGALYAAGGLAALGAAGGGLKLIPPVLAASGTAAAALPGILGGAIQSALVLKLGLMGVGDALGDIYKAKDPFTRLTPNAKEFLTVAAQVKPTLLGFQAGLQQRVTNGLGQDLQLFATKTLPQVQGSLNRLATDWSETFAELALVSADPAVTEAFNSVAGGADAFFDAVNARIRPTARAIATLVTEAEPVADQVGQALIGVLDRFAAKVEEAKRNGSLEEFFEAGAESAREMLSIAGDITRILGMVVSETTKQNDAVRGTADALKAYVNSGRAAEDVAGIVHTLTVAYEGLASVLGPIGGLLRDALADPGTAQSIQTMFQILAAASSTVASLLQGFLALNGALGGVPLTVLAIVAALTKMRGIMLLATAATTKGAAALQTYGGTAEKVAGKLPGFVAGIGSAATALLALNIAHTLIDEWQGPVKLDELNTSIENMIKKGETGGEIARLFGKDLSGLNQQLDFVQDADGGGFAGFLDNMEKAVPIAGDLVQALGFNSFEGSRENLVGLDTQLTEYIQKTGDVEGAQKFLNQVLDEGNVGWADLRDQIPNAAAAMEGANAEIGRLQNGTAGLAERQALLNTPIDQTVTLVRSLIDVYNELNGANVNFATTTAAAEAAIDGLSAGLKTNGLALNAQKDGYDLTIEKGRTNLALTTSLTTAAAAAAQAKLDDNGTVTEAAGVYDRYINQLRRTLALQGASPGTIDAIVSAYATMPTALEGATAASNNLNGALKTIPKGTKFVFDGQTLIDGKGQTLDLEGSLKGIPAGKKYTWNGKSLVDGKGKAVDLKGALDDIPKEKDTKVNTETGAAESNIDGVSGKLNAIDGKTATTYIKTVFPKNFIGPVPAGSTYTNAAGGIYTRKAQEGLVSARLAPAGTLYQWAEPETGGEAFIPRRGDKRRGREILGVAASWYDTRVVPMAMGGVRAASGLVNVAPTPVEAPTPRASRLDFAESYLAARDAVKALSASLKENGRSFTLATAKGRENRSALYSGIRAAQDAATTKFEETKNVRLANRAYDEHIARLRATLVQQKVNAATIRSLLSLAQRPTYDVATVEPKAPTNSANRIALARSQIAAAGGIEGLRDSLTLNRPTIGLGTPEGRDNLSGILDFLGQAEAAAQDRFAQSGSAKLATATYNRYVIQLRQALAGSGFSKKAIDSIVNAYGRITLTKNAAGGVYSAAAGGVMSLGVGQAGIYPSSSTLYGFAEPGTGGEAFIPRNGDRRRGRDLVDVAAGWYGGRFTAGGGGGGASSYDYSTHMTITPLTYNPSTTELLGFQRQMDVQARVGRRR